LARGGTIAALRDLSGKGAGDYAMHFHRRQLLATAAWFLAGTAVARASSISGSLPWNPNAGHPPQQVRPGSWQYFTHDEANAVEAIVDRIIPPDPQTPGGKDAGCGVYIDRQLAGPYGKNEGLFRGGPFQEGAKSQGPQSPETPAELYRKGLAALDKHCKDKFGGKGFAALSDADKDAVLHELDNSEMKFGEADGKVFFDQILKDTQQGFFADPIYGGNKDMTAWKMIGFPGARYNYLDWVDRHNERFPLPPVSIAGSINWTPKG
jgi:gluconate 2-dehydrogenase gamma chain